MLQELARHSESVFWSASPSEGLVYLSPAFANIWGRDPADVLGEISVFVGTIHTDDRARVTAWIEDGLQSGEPGTTEYRVVRPDGTERWVRTRAFGMRDEAGTVTRFAGLADDVTDDHRARIELAETTRRLMRTFASLQEAVFVVDLATRRILDCNPAAERMFGYPRDELVGEGTEKLHVSEASHAAFSRDFDAILERDGVVRMDWEMRRGDGSTFESEHTVTLLDTVPGLASGVVSVVRDVSVERGLERQLRHAQKMEALGRLAGGVAHDFNNLLTVVRGHAEMALDDLPEGSSVGEELGRILESVERGTSLTRQLLALSRKQVMNERVMDLSALVMGMVPTLRRLVPADIELDVSPAGGPRPVRVDPDQIHQVVLNLVVNAMQAIRGAGRIGLTLDEPVAAEPTATGARSRARTLVRLTVTDTGPGIPPEVMERIFEPFYTTKTEEHGTGLGLSIVFGIVTQSGGHVVAESPPGGGARFTVVLPLAEAGTAGEARAEPGSARGQGELGGRAVLLVEDEAALRTVVRRGLERAGLTVMVAADGEEALEIVRGPRGRELDIVVSDVVMPRMSGPVFIERLREVAPGLRVILVSGYSETTRPDLLGAGATAFLEKPFSIHDLTALIRRTLTPE